MQWYVSAVDVAARGWRAWGKRAAVLTVGERSVAVDEGVLLSGKARHVERAQDMVLLLYSDRLAFRAAFADSKRATEHTIWFSNVYALQCVTTTVVIKCYIPHYRGKTKGDPFAGVNPDKGIFAVHTFDFGSFDEAQDWHWRALTTLQEAGELPVAVKLLVIVNPYGGAKKGRKIYQQCVWPMLSDAGIQIETFITAHQGHGTEIGRTIAVEKYSGIVCVSGDGLLHELLNGLLSRDDWPEAIRIPLGIIPGGSGNALARSLDSADPCAATFAVLKGATRPMDLLAMTQGDRTVYSHLSLTYGLIADIDIKSESLRFLGETRFTVSGLLEAFAARSYNFKLAILRAPPTSSGASDATATTAILRERSDTATSAAAVVGADPSTPLRAAAPRRNGPPLRWRSLSLDALPDGWELVEHTARGIVVMNVPWLATTTCIAPTAVFCDGLVDIVVTRRGSLAQTGQWMLALDSTDIDKSPLTEHCQAAAVMFVPEADSHILAIDGERVDCKPTIVEVLPQLARIYCPRELPTSAPR